MLGLKKFLPHLSKLLFLSKGALYARQRELVRVGLLENVEGRGPGSGVRLTPETVGMLLIAVLSTDNLSEVAEKTKALVNLKPSVKRPGEPKTFKAAMISALSGDAGGDETVSVNRTNLQASIQYASRKVVYFGNLPHHGNAGLSVISEIVGVIELTRELLKLAETEPAEKLSLRRAVDSLGAKHLLALQRGDIQPPRGPLQMKRSHGDGGIDTRGSRNPIANEHVAPAKAPAKKRSALKKG